MSEQERLGSLMQSIRADVELLDAILYALVIGEVTTLAQALRHENIYSAHLAITNLDSLVGVEKSQIIVNKIMDNLSHERTNQNMVC